MRGIVVQEGFVLRQGLPVALVGISMACSPSVDLPLQVPEGARPILLRASPTGTLSAVVEGVPIDLAEGEQLVSLILPTDHYFDVNGRPMDLDLASIGRVGQAPPESCERCLWFASSGPEIASPGDQCPLSDDVTTEIWTVRDGEVTPDDGGAIRSALRIQWPGSCACQDRSVGPARRLQQHRLNPAALQPLPFLIADASGIVAATGDDILLEKVPDEPIRTLHHGISGLTQALRHPSGVYVLGSSSLWTLEPTSGVVTERFGFLDATTLIENDLWVLTRNNGRNRMERCTLDPWACTQEQVPLSCFSGISAGMGVAGGQLFVLSSLGELAVRGSSGEWTCLERAPSFPRGRVVELPDGGIVTCTEADPVTAWVTDVGDALRKRTAPMPRKLVELAHGQRCANAFRIGQETFLTTDPQGTFVFDTNFDLVRTSTGESFGVDRPVTRIASSADVALLRAYDDTLYVRGPDGSVERIRAPEAPVRPHPFVLQAWSNQILALGPTGQSLTVSDESVEVDAIAAWDPEEVPVGLAVHSLDQGAVITSKSQRFWIRPLSWSSQSVGDAFELPGVLSVDAVAPLGPKVMLADAEGQLWLVDSAGEVERVSTPTPMSHLEYRDGVVWGYGPAAFGRFAWSASGPMAELFSGTLTTEGRSQPLEVVGFGSECRADARVSVRHADDSGLDVRSILEMSLSTGGCGQDAGWCLSSPTAIDEKVFAPFDQGASHAERSEKARQLIARGFHVDELGFTSVPGTFYTGGFVRFGVSVGGTMVVASDHGQVTRIRADE